MTILINFATNRNRDGNVDGVFPLTLLRVGREFEMNILLDQSRIHLLKTNLAF